MAERQSIWKRFIGWLTSDWRNLAIAVLLVLLGAAYFGYRTMKDSYENSVVVIRDSLEVYKNKAGELYMAQQGYITDIDELKKQNRELYEEAKNLRDNPIVLTKYKTVTEIREITVRDTVNSPAEGVFTTGISYADDWTDIQGKTTIDVGKMGSETEFTKISFRNSYTLDLVERKKGDRKGQLAFIVKSDNPHCTINSLEGVMLSPESSENIRKRFTKKWSVVAGAGVSVGVRNGKVAAYPAIQVTVGKNIISF